MDAKSQFHGRGKPDLDQIFVARNRLRLPAAILLALTGAQRQSSVPVVVPLVAGRLDDNIARFGAALREFLESGFEHALAVVRAGVHPQADVDHHRQRPAVGHGTDIVQRLEVAVRVSAAALRRESPELFREVHQPCGRPGVDESKGAGLAYQENRRRSAR